MDLTPDEAPPQGELFSEEIVEGVKAGNPDAVGAVYVVLADRLLGYLTARVRDRTAAEDLLEATFVELLQNGATITGGSAAIKVWLFRAAYFNALDHIRRRRRRGEDVQTDLSGVDIVDLERGPQESLEVAEIVSEVHDAMRLLSDEQRQVLLMRYIAGLSAAEVATIMQKSDGAIRSLQHRGEKSLARLLEGNPHGAASSWGRRASTDKEE
jgi:RNA polymerase sigma-70 factor, ECF subfamily